MSSTPELKSSCGFWMALFMALSRQKGNIKYTCIYDNLCRHRSWIFPLICFCWYFLERFDYLHQVVKESCIEGFGQGVPCVGGLLLVQGHVNGLGLPSPLWIHLPAGQLVLQAVRVNAQQIGREGEYWKWKVVFKINANISSTSWFELW